MGGSKKTTVGYKYNLGLHAIFTHGPIDEVSRVLFDDKLAWSGNLTALGDIYINQPNLFGGEDIGAEGGVQGTVHFQPGTPTQGRNAYLQSKLGTEIPAFRGVSGMVFNDFYFGTSKYIKAVSARMTRIHKTSDNATQWYDEKAEIGGAAVFGVNDNWEYQTVATTTPPADPAAFPVPSGGWSGPAGAPFGHVVVTPPYPVVTAWAVQTALWMRKTVDLGDFPPLGFIVSGRVENGVFLYWDGEYIGSNNPTNSDLVDFPAFSFNIPEHLLTAGEHVVALYCMDEATTNVNDNTYIHCVGLGQYQRDMNPAHIIRECLINQAWGMGYQEADIDDESFTDAADVLYDEGFGLSLLWDRQMQIDQFIGEIIKHIDGALYVDRKTGLFTLKLIRGDYDVETLPLLDENNIDKLEGFSRPTFGELVNSVSVNFWDASTGTESSLTITDPALIQMQGAVINTTLQYPGITNHQLASRVGMRDLTTLSNPLVSCTIYSNSVAEDFTIGSVFLFSWEDYGIVEMPMRVTAIAYGDGVKNAVKMTCTQDVFKLPATSTITPPSTGWEDPNQPAEPIEIQYAEEMTYYELVQREGQSDADVLILANPNVGLSAFAASRPQDAAINARIWTDAGAGYEEVIATVDFAPSAKLDADVGYMDTVFTLKDIVDESLIEVGTYATFPGGEKVYVEDYNSSTNELTVRRAVHDTTPQIHLENDVIFFDDVYQSSDGVEYIESDELDIKLLTVTGAGQSELADATPMTIDFDSRAARPYPPANVKVNDEYWPEAVLSPVEVTFVTRNRLLQTSPDLLGFTDAGITPEASCNAAIEVFDDDDDTLLFSALSIPSPYDITSYCVANTRIEVFSHNTAKDLQSRYRVVVPFQFNVIEFTLGYRIPVTVPNASIAATLSNFPVYLDLSTLPSEFWTNLIHDDGGDIRIKDGSGNQLPFDLVWIDRGNSRGALFYKQTLTDGGDTVAYVHYGIEDDELLADNDTYGRNAVWSDYEAVYTFGADISDRTGKRLELSPVTTAPFGFENTSTSADLGVHQGVAFNGTNYFVVNNNEIKKYNTSFTLVTSNTDPCGDVTTATGDTVDHCGDPCVHNGMLYVPVEIYVNVSTWSNMKIARFNLTTLALIDVVDIDAQNHEAASICYCPKDDLMYVASYADNTKLFKYNPSTLAYVGSLTLTGVAHARFQGVTWWRNQFWISSDETTNKSVWPCTYAGVKRNKLFTVTSGNMEGLSTYNNEGLLVLHDTTGSNNGVVRRLIPYRTAHAGGGVLMTNTNNEQYVTLSVATLTSWTIGVSLNMASVGANRGLVSYEVSGSTVNTNRATLAYRHATTQFGLWNTTDSWLLDTITPSINTLYRLHGTQNGTTDRKFYRNGGNVQTDSGVVQKPGSTGHVLYIGIENLTGAEDMNGLMGFTYLRSGVLSANWIAAEYSNLNAPGSFYSVGAEEEVLVQFALESVSENDPCFILADNSGDFIAAFKGDIVFPDVPALGIYETNGSASPSYLLNSFDGRFSTTGNYIPANYFNVGQHSAPNFRSPRKYANSDGYIFIWPTSGYGGGLNNQWLFVKGAGDLTISYLPNAAYSIVATYIYGGKFYVIRLNGEVFESDDDGATWSSIGIATGLTSWTVDEGHNGQFFEFGGETYFFDSQILARCASNDMLTWEIVFTPLIDAPTTVYNQMSKGEVANTATSIIITGVAHKIVDDTDYNIILRSEDGENFTLVREIDAEDEDATPAAMSWDVPFKFDTGYILYGKNDFSGVFPHALISTDDGETWGTPQPLDLDDGTNNASLQRIVSNGSRIVGTRFRTGDDDVLVYSDDGINFSYTAV